MFEARMAEAGTFKRVVDAMKDLVTDANLDCSSGGINIQAMDSSHVSLVALVLRAEGFDMYRCDRSLTLGLNLANLSKILKCASNEDSMTLKAEENADELTFIFESSTDDKISEFKLKLMDIDAEQLGIPETEYKVTVNTPSSEFQRMVRDFSQLGDTATIGVSKDGMSFSVAGDIGSGCVTQKQASAADAEAGTTIDVEEPVELSFAMRYLNFFTKATPLSNTVTLMMSPDVPLVVEYKMGDAGHIQYFLAPKLSEA